MEVEMKLKLKEPVPLRAMLERTEHDHVCNALALNHGCVAAAARWLGIPLSTMRFTLRKHKIDPNQYRNDGAK
jgi:transcriptional regulator with GAF, ATPase, and Fis domain